MEIEHDNQGLNAKECFRLYEDGYYKNGKNKILTRHPNILYSVLTGKKGFGLWIDQWSDGIIDWTFTYDEIINEFTIRDIEIPESLLKDFNNRIDKKWRNRNLKYLEERRNSHK
jgi:hypothetical protein